MSDIKLYQGDCLPILKQMQDNSVDLILTDPPYEYDNHGGGNTELAQRKLVKEKHIDFMSSGFDLTILNEFLRVCITPNILMFCSNQQISKLMGYFESKGIPVTLLVWHKINPPPLCNGKYLSDCEFVVYAHGKNATFNNDCPFDFKKKVYVSSVVPAKDRLHPAQKPIDLLNQYIQLHSNPEDTILDPFMGSGSTGVACKNLNRNFIGMELNPDYFQIAKQRIADSVQIHSVPDNTVQMKAKKLF